MKLDVTRDAKGRPKVRLLRETSSDPPADRLAALESRVAALEAEIAQSRKQKNPA